MTAAAVIVSFWDSTTNAAAYITLFGGLVIISNVLFVRVYGELEFTFATLKILLIVGLNLMVCHKLQAWPHTLWIKLGVKIQNRCADLRCAVQALVLVCGGGPDGEVIGFRYWRNPGPLVQYLDVPGPLGRFMGFWTTFSNAVYSFS